MAKKANTDRDWKYFMKNRMHDMMGFSPKLIDMELIGISSTDKIICAVDRYVYTYSTFIDDTDGIKKCKLEQKPLPIWCQENNYPIVNNINDVIMSRRKRYTYKNKEKNANDQEKESAEGQTTA